MSNDWLVLVLVGLPLVIATVLALVEVVGRTDLEPLRTVVWVIALVGVPVIVVAVYAVVRPIGRAGEVLPDADASPGAERLVDAAERRQRGEMDDDEFRAVVAGLGR